MQEPRSKIQNLGGFTLLELIIVIAIIGILITIGAAAIGSAQKEQRDFQRREAVRRIIGQVEAYAGRNGGTYPADQTAFAAAGFAGAYLVPTSDFQDPLAKATYKWTGTAGTISTSNPAGVAYTLPSSGKFQVCIDQERGAAYCQP